MARPVAPHLAADPPVPASKRRRLVLRDTNGELLLTDRFGRPLPHFQIDLTGIQHANSQCAILAAVQEQCNLGCWHDVSANPLPPWGAD